MSFKSALAITAMLLVGACSSIVHESQQTITINTNPQGALLKIDGRAFTTPAAVMLKGKPEYYFTVEKPGYKMAAGKVDGNFRVMSTVVGNIFNLSGILGFAVDYWGTQTAFELQKDNTITMEPMPLPPMDPAAPLVTAPGATLSPTPGLLLQPLPGEPVGMQPMLAPAPLAAPAPEPALGIPVIR